MEIKKKIEDLINAALDDYGIRDASFLIEHPDDLMNGDYSTNVALSCWKKFEKDLKPGPMEVAEMLGKKIRERDEGIKIKVVQPGFINFFLSQKFFADSLKEAKGKDFGKNKSLKGQKTIVEHTDPNPFKEFHVGHLMPNVIGSTVARILEWNDAEVKQACYQGDVGLHVARAVWALKNGIDIKNAYAIGTKAYEDKEEVKREIEEINKKIYQKSDKELNDIYDKGRKESLEYFDSIYAKLGTHFDFFFFESEVADVGKEIVKKNVGRIFEVGDPEPSRQGGSYGAGDGAPIVFKAEKYDKTLHTRVFINKEGLPTYEAKELGLAKVKYDKYRYDKSIIITGNEINEYFKVLLAAMKEIFPELAEKTLHFSHGMLRLPYGKMSSRTGDVITAESLIEEVKKKVKEDEGVAIGAIKYMILRQSIGGDIIFFI